MNPQSVHLSKVLNESTKNSASKQDEDDRRKVLIIVTGGHLVAKSETGYKKQKESISEGSSVSSFDLKKQLENDKDFHHYKLPLFDILVWTPLIEESSSMEYEDIVKLGLQIKKYYYEYDGFVIIQGVRTMAYTAAYLSFMLENLGKCIVLTDAYLRLADIFTDAKTNLLSSLLVSSRSDIAEVCVCFNKKVFRGNRVIRVDNSSPDMFMSPNLPPIAKFSPNLVLSKHRIYQLPKKRFQLQTRLFTNIILIYLTPSMNDEMFKAILHAKMKSKGFINDQFGKKKNGNESNLSNNLKGIIVSFYGCGNAPERASFKNILKEAIEQHNCEIIVTSQPLIGPVNIGLYAAGNYYSDLNIISSMDMTNECIVAKLSYLLGKNYRGSKLKQEFERSLRGELTPFTEIIAKTVNYKTRVLATSNILNIPTANKSMETNLIEANTMELNQEKQMINNTKDNLYKTSDIQHQLTDVHNSLYDKTMENIQVLQVGDIKVSSPHTSQHQT